jgi:hypothetical protein
MSLSIVHYLRNEQGSQSINRAGRLQGGPRGNCLSGGELPRSRYDLVRLLRRDRVGPSRGRYALTGDTERAAADLAEARRLSPDDRYSTLARLKEHGAGSVPKVYALFEATYFAGLRKAGMPEQ